MLYGSRARGDAEWDSDVGLLVVLDACDDPWEEMDRNTPVAARVSLQHGVVLSALAVGRRELEEGRTPLLLNVRREGKPVG